MIIPYCGRNESKRNRSFTKYSYHPASPKYMRKRNNINTTPDNTIDFQSPETNNRKSRFRNVTMAMINSRGPNCEDRKITRKMRNEIGGVVDLTQEVMPRTYYKITKVNKYKKTVRREINPRMKIDAARIIQAWWRNLKDEEIIEYQATIEKVIRIQSIIRGYIARMRFFKVISLKLYYQNFLNLMRGIFSKIIII